MTKFHSDDYIRFIRSIRPDNMNEYNKQMQKCEYKGRGDIGGCRYLDGVVEIGVWGCAEVCIGGDKG